MTENQLRQTEREDVKCKEMGDEERDVLMRNTVRMRMKWKQDTAVAGVIIHYLNSLPAQPFGHK